MATIYLTPEGKKQLEEKLNMYKTVKRPEAIANIGIAREFGDLSENAEYDRAKEEQGRIEEEIANMEATLRDAIIVAKKSTSKVMIGSKVKLLDVDYNEELTYKIVGTTESDPLNGNISNESPVGKAVLGKEKGEEVEVITPNGSMILKIVDIM